GPRRRPARAASTKFFSLAHPASLLEDPGRDEDQQLVVFLGPGLVAEEISQDRDLPEAGDHVVLVLVVDLEDAAYHRGPAVAHQDLALVLPHRQRDVLPDRQVPADGPLP